MVVGGSMKKILEKYSTRLINVSGRNRSLVMKRLYKKRAFDLFNLKSFDSEIDDKLIQFLQYRKVEELQLTEDPYEWYQGEIVRLKEEHQLAKDKIMLNLKESDKYTEENILKIEEELQKKFSHADEKLRKRQEKLIMYSNSLNTLLKEIKSTFKETGRYELYVGYPFVQGYFKDKTFVKAPLFLFPVEVIKKRDKWYIKNKVNEPVSLNKVFLVAYAKFNEEKMPQIQIEYNDLKIFDEDLIEGVLQTFKKEHIFLTHEERNLYKFQEITKETTLDYKLGELEIKNNLILGHFNIASSIYNDYKEMEANGLSNSIMLKLLKNEEVALERNEGVQEQKGQEKDIVEKDYYFISELDYSQEIAVKRATEYSELVIYGPPGTGKSQTIVNIVAQYLSQGKKVLMVSQKKAALDVIYNRAASINSKMIMANKEIDKKQFYAMIAGRIDALKGGYIKNKQSIEQIACYIDKQLDKLREVEHILTKKQDSGQSLQVMYSKPRILLESESYLNEFFKLLRRANPFEAMSDERLETICRSLLEGEQISQFYRLKNIFGDNPYAVLIKDTIDCYDLEDAKEAIGALLKGYDESIDQLKQHMIYYEEVQKIDQRVVSLQQVAQELNKQKNGHLLECLTGGSKFSLKYWLNLKKNKQQEELNLKLFEAKQKEFEQVLQEDIDSLCAFKDKFDVLNIVLHQNQVDKLKQVYQEIEEVKLSFKDILAILEEYEEMSLLKAKVHELDEDTIKVLEYVYEQQKDLDCGVQIVKVLPNLINQMHIAKLQREYMRELEVIGEFGKIRNEISKAMDIKRKEVPTYINEKWDIEACNKRMLQEKVWKEMYRQCTKKSQLLPIREFVSKFETDIFSLFPCWLLSPEAVSEILPLTEGLFDLIIFDEASQMFIESAIPTIYRGKKVVVAGDDKQLRPSSIFNSKYEEEESEDEELEAALEEESLLDLAKYSFKDTSLYYHYRSKYDELINFSNYAFYGGKLEVSPNVYKTSEEDIKPIQRIKVEGTWVERTNPKEAKEVVRLIRKILIERKNEETIGIITFNINQRDLIEELLEIEAGKDPVFGKLYYSEIDRIEKNEDISLFVKNIENVQGDERDIIIFSTAYARNAQGRIVASFGTLSQDGGENRLNVAISRAKQKVYVVTSIEPEDLNVDNSRNRGPKLLKKYLQYVKAVSEGNQIVAEEILYSVCDSSLSRNNDIHYDSDFESQVHEALCDRGLMVDTQIGVSGYKIDLAVYDEKRSKYILGIECDGAAFHSSKSARERDVYRQRYLEGRGWNIIRIWSKDWWSNPEREVDKIVKRVIELQEESNALKSSM